MRNFSTTFNKNGHHLSCTINTLVNKGKCNCDRLAYIKTKKAPLIERILLPIGRIFAIVYPFSILHTWRPDLVVSLMKAANQLLETL